MSVKKPDPETMGRVTKVVLLDKSKEPIAAATTQQEVEDAFSYTQGVQEPPYKLEQLLDLAERHPTHAAAIDQKSSDVAGTGWEWVKDTDDADEVQKDELDKWFRSLADPDGDQTIAEILESAWNDVETFGQGFIEVGRDGNGVARTLFSMPGQTMRFHKDGVRVVQQKAGSGVTKRVWFRRYSPGSGDVTVAKTGGRLLKAKGDADDLGNDVIVLRRSSRRSSLYGVPTYVAAIGWVHLALAARDDNIQFFQNRREPRWAIVLQNIYDEDGSLEEALKQAFSTSLASPHRNVFIPIEGDGKVEFKQMSSDVKDMSFEKLQERADAFVLTSHKMPPERLGFGRVGPLGGNATFAASEIYKEAVVVPAQNLLANRLTRFVKAEFAKAHDMKVEDIKWSWRPKELDLTTEAEDVGTVVAAFQGNLITLNEARAKMKMTLIEGENGGKFFYELAPDASVASAAAGTAARFGAEQGAAAGQRRADAALGQATLDLNRKILDVLTPGD